MVKRGLLQSSHLTKLVLVVARCMLQDPGSSQNLLPSVLRCQSSEPESAWLLSCVKAKKRNGQALLKSSLRLQALTQYPPGLSTSKSASYTKWHWEWKGRRENEEIG